MGFPFRFIHCGDLHLGAPFKHINHLGKQVHKVAIEATYKSFQNIVDFAMKERVDAVVISGDIYNSDDHNLEAQVRFVREMERLQTKNIQVYVVQGNHDPAGSWYAGLVMPTNVHIFDATAIQRYPLRIGGRDVAGIYGISCSAQNKEENIALQYKRLDIDAYAIGVLHGTVGSQNLHDVTAPCNLSDLNVCGMDYWALGHIHKREVLQETPYVVYAGNPQGLHRKEMGAKGCYLVKVSANGHTEIEFKETNAVRFEHARIDITNLRTVQDIEEMIRHKKEMWRNKSYVPILLELVFTGRGELYNLCQQEAVRQLWLEASQKEEVGRKHSFVMPILIENQTQPTIDLMARRQLPDMVGDYLLAYDEVYHLSEADKVEKLKEILMARPEMKRLGRYSQFVDDDMLLRALRRAELEGAIRLIGNETDQE